MGQVKGFPKMATTLVLGGGVLIALLGLRMVPLWAQDQPNPVDLAQQSLPITAEVQIQDQIIRLEVASTPEEQEIGLMFRTDLPANRGMLFPFDPPRPVSFWMKNTLIPLDMLFVYQGKIREIAAEAQPCKQASCPIYGTNELVDQVIELKSGRAAELGLKVGDTFPVKRLPTAPSSLQSS